MIVIQYQAESFGSCGLHTNDKNLADALAKRFVESYEKRGIRIKSWELIEK